MRKIAVIFILLSFWLVQGFLPVQSVFAQPNSGDLRFNLDPEYDAAGREAAVFQLVKQSDKAYFYVDKNFWEKNAAKNKFLASIDLLGKEFDENIYPKLTSLYGTEWSPGVDNDRRITIVFHEMKDDAAGYFREKDEYPKVQAPSSNEREMIFLNADFADSVFLKSYLAHEFTHLITFYQKNMILGVEDAVWLNEMRADYSSTYLGYNNILAGSYLEKRVKRFVSKPTGSLTEWENEIMDYGTVSLFAHYLVDHYGVRVLADTMKSKKTGIDAINEYLQKRGYKADFKSIFTNWTIASFLNDCAAGPYYCYKTSALKNFRIAPAINFLPSRGESSLKFVDSLDNWSVRWYKILGGNNDLKFSFKGDGKGNFALPYIIEKKDGAAEVEFLYPRGEEYVEAVFPDFYKKYNYFAFIPSLQNAPDGLEKTANFTWNITSYKNPDAINIPDAGKQARIEAIKEQIMKLQDRLIELLQERILEIQRQIKLFGSVKK